MDPEWVRGFITSSCTLGKHDNGKPYEVNSRYLYDEYNLYLDALGIRQRISSTKFYKILTALPESKDVVRRRKTSGYCHEGIILTKDIASFNLKPVYSEEQRVVSRKESNHRYYVSRRDCLVSTTRTSPIPPIVETVAKQVESSITMATIPVSSTIPPVVALTSLYPAQKYNHLNIVPITVSAQANNVSPFGSFIPPRPLTPCVSKTPRVMLKIARSQPVVRGLRWDGSHLGKLDYNVFSYIGVSHETKAEYFGVTCDSIPYVVTRKRSPSSIPNIIDELKVVFGLTKMGTHSCILPDGHRYLLSRVPLCSDGRTIVNSKRLIDCNVDPPSGVDEFDAGIRKIFVFRELMGLAKTNEATVLIHCDDDGKFTPVSYRESAIEPGDCFVLPDTVYYKWFPEPERGCPVSITTARMLDVNTEDVMTNKLAALRTEMASIINRIDKEEITMMNGILDRVNRRLLIALRDKDLI